LRRKPAHPQADRGGVWLDQDGCRLAQDQVARAGAHRLGIHLCSGRLQPGARPPATGRGGSMTRNTLGFTRAFAGRWRIVEMDQWEDLDLLEPAHITFTGKDGGELVFVAVEADLDVRYGSRDGSACAEFSWEGSDDNAN